MESMTAKSFERAAALLMCALLFTATNNRIQESSLSNAAAGEQETRREK
jgi:hypothetical protein